MFEMEIILFGGGTLAASQFQIEATCAYTDSVYSSCICRLSKGEGTRRLSIALSVVDVVKHRIHIWYKNV